ADQEKNYKARAAAPQPRLTGVRLTTELFPREQRVRMRGTFDLANKNAVPVDTIHLFFLQGEDLQFNKLAFATPATLAKEDMQVGLRTYKRATPLAPGATTTLAFDLEVPTRGFRNDSSNTAVVYNGS